MFQEKRRTGKTKNKKNSRWIKKSEKIIMKLQSPFNTLLNTLLTSIMLENIE